MTLISSNRTCSAALRSGFWPFIRTLAVCLVAVLSHTVPLVSTAAGQTVPARPEPAEPPATAPETASPLSAQLRGDTQMARHEYVRALATYQTIQPRTALVWNEIGLAYHHLFALDLALQSYQQALLLNPRSSEALNNIGAVYFGKQEFALAERAYKAALRVNPQAATTYSNLGTAYFAEAKYKKGATAYRKAYELNPKVFAAENAIEEGSSREQRGAAEFSLAEMYASLGQTEMALTSLRKALSAGFTDRRRLLQDRELASLRESPEFHRLLAEQHLQ